MNYFWKLTQYVDDPQVAQAILDSTNQWSAAVSALKVAPTNSASVIKRGGVDAGIIVAARTTDPKLINKLSRDRRKSVREALLSNPMLPQDTAMHMARESLRRDKPGDDVQDAAIRRLTPDQYVDLLVENRTDRFTVQELTWSGCGGETYLASHTEAPVFRVHELLPEGPALLRRLVDEGFARLVTNNLGLVNPDNLKPGSLTWIFDELPRPLRGAVIAWAIRYYRADKFTLEDARAVRRHLASGVWLQPEADPERRGPALSAEVSRELLACGDPTVTSTLATFTALPTDVLDRIVDSHHNLHSTLLANVKSGWSATSLATVMHNTESVKCPVQQMRGILQGMSDTEYARLDSATVIKATYAEHTRHVNGRPILARVPPPDGSRSELCVDWITGRLNRQPTPGEVAQTLEAAEAPLPGIRDDVIGLLLRSTPDPETQEVLAGLISADIASAYCLTQVANMFKRHFGNDTEAWSLAVRFGGEGFDGSLKDLIDTVSALTGVDG